MNANAYSQVRRLRLTLGDRAANAVLSGKALRPGDSLAFDDVESFEGGEEDARSTVDAATVIIDRPWATSVNTSAFGGA